MIGQTVSHFRIVKRLGQGGMGAVYEALDTKLDRRVALKVVAGADVSDDDRARLLREAQVAASLNHRHICSVHLVDEVDGQLFIVMELVEGPTLADVLADGPLPPARACELLDQLAAAMSHAHERGVVHRDLKPGNIMLTADGEPRIMDFGLAVRRGAGGGFDPEEIGGTLAYLAPEVIHGEDPDELTDVWALGVVFYEMLTGQPPFAGAYTAALQYDIAHGAPAPVSESTPRAAALQEPLVDRMLAKDRAARLRSMDAVRETIRGLDVSRPQARRWVLAAAATAVVVIASLVIFWPRPGIEPLQGPVIAVMPLTASGTDEELRDFAAGFSSEVTGELAKVAELRVIAHSSMLHLVDQDLTPGEVASRLGADHVVGGTVRRDGDNLRVSAELLDGRDSRVLWAESFATDPSSILILQASVARAVAAKLKGELSDREERALTATAQIDPEAYRAYVKAMALIDHWGVEENWDQATRLLQTTTRLEPTFAPAWAALAQIYNNRAWFDTSPERNFLGMNRAAIDRALELDSELPAAHVELGNTAYMFDDDVATADAAYQRALELAPNDAYAHNQYAMLFLVFMARCEEAEYHARQAAVLSPLAQTNRREYALTLIKCRRYREALDYLDAVEDLHTEKYYLWYHRSVSLAYLDRRDEAVAAADSAVAHGMAAHALAPVYWSAGHRDEAWESCGGRQATADTLGFERSMEAGILRMLEGDPDPVLDRLESMYPDYKPYLRFYMVAEVFDPIRDEPRFAALCEAMHLPND